MSDDERRIAWLALDEGTPVVDSGGQEIGKVSEVVADRQKDIFSGIRWRHGLLGSQHYLPADMVAELTSAAVHLTVSGDEAVEQAPPG